MEDQWWISLDGFTMQTPQTLDVAEAATRSGSHQSIQVIHVSQAQEENPLWVELDQTQPTVLIPLRNASQVGTPPTAPSRPVLAVGQYAIQRQAAAAIPVEAPSKSPELAAILEIVCGLFLQIFGIGNIYAGNIRGGIAFMIGYWLMALVGIILTFWSFSILGIGGIIAAPFVYAILWFIAFLVWMYNASITAVDAARAYGKRYATSEQSGCGTVVWMIFISIGLLLITTVVLAVSVGGALAR